MCHYKYLMSLYKRETINTVISCWVGSSMENEHSGFPPHGSRDCTDGGEIAGLEFLSCPVNCNHHYS